MEKEQRSILMTAALSNTVRISTHHLISPQHIDDSISTRFDEKRAKINFSDTIALSNTVSQSTYRLVSPQHIYDSITTRFNVKRTKINFSDTST